MKWIFSYILIALLNCVVYAQTPENFSYQGIVRDNSNMPVGDREVNVKILIKQGSPNGSSVYEELHSTQTNTNGLISLQIGSGNKIQGDFSKIDWAHGPFFIESQTDPTGGSNYSLSGISPMLSVPYALHAKSAQEFNGTIQAAQIENISAYINGENSVFYGWDKNSIDDFSGNYEDLTNKPALYSREEIDQLFTDINIQEYTSQSLNLEGNQLLISGGNEVIFDNWDMNAADDFSGDYQDLQNKPDLFTGNYEDLTNQPEIYTQVEVNELIANIGDQNGISQSLNLEGNQLLISGGNEVTFENWDMNAADDFSGDYQDLQNKPDLFNGNYEDLTNQPEIYTQVEVNELIANIGDQNGISQSLNLEGNQLLISGGNEVIFENWDMNATDDFSGDYQDLQNKPDLFTGNYEDLINQPEILTVTEVKNLIADTENNGEQFQQLSLDGNKVSISEGNSISFVNWDMNADDDFSGDYIDLKNKPDLFNGDYQELENLPDLYSRKEVDDLVANLENNDGKPQSLTLENNKLSIENGNSIVFEGWDTNASDDFDGNYSSLIDAPKIYTQAEVDKIKEEILKEAAEKYSKKAQVISLTSSRSINTEDIGNTIACSKSATLTIPCYIFNGAIFRIYYNIVCDFSILTSTTQTNSHTIFRFSSKIIKITVFYCDIFHSEYIIIIMVYRFNSHPPNILKSAIDNDYFFRSIRTL